MARVLDSVTLPIKKNGTKTNQNYVNNPKSTAGQFSTSTAYAVGQYVYYDKKLYRFTTAHAAGAWNASHVTEVTVTSELTSLKAETNDLKQDLSNITGVDTITEWSSPSRNYYDLSVSPAVIMQASSSGGITDWQYAVVPCSEGDVFTVSGTGGSRPRAWGFVDASYNTIQVETASVNTELKLITAPTNSAYLIIDKRASITTKASYYGALIPTNFNAIESEIAGVNTELDKALTLSHSYASVISNNTNYDTITTPGNYYVSSASNAQTMTNCPVTVAHRLIVIATTSSSRIKQIVIANAAKTPIWIRDTGESIWYKIPTDDVVLKQQTTFVTGTIDLPFTDCDDAPVNTVYTINGSASVANLPPGNSNVAGASDTPGTTTGTLITIGGTVYNNGTVITQLYMTAATSPSGLSGASVEPVLNYRYKFYSNDTWTWAPWSKLTEYGLLHSTNTFIQESRIQAGTALFDDMNDAPNNAIVQIDLDAVSMANNPLSGHSCVLVTFSASYISRHGSFQLCMGLDNGAHMFFRYGYQQSTEEYRWTAWRECGFNEVAQQIPALPTTNGHYVLGVTIADGVPTFAWETA